MLNQTISLFEPLPDKEGKVVATFFYLVGAIGNLVYAGVTMSLLALVAGLLILPATFVMRKYGYDK